ncbi:hypothetical protein PI124_g19662 [Phytophthora idaei]|nr:hypothetical protein PI124_g19662 [Phytophthora idaei]
MAELASRPQSTQRSLAVGPDGGGCSTLLVFSAGPRIGVLLSLVGVSWREEGVAVCPPVAGASCVWVVMLLQLLALVGWVSFSVRLRRRGYTQPGDVPLGLKQAEDGG